MFIFFIVLLSILFATLVCPICSFATAYQNFYSIIIGSALLLLAIYISVREFKKHGIAVSIRFILKLAIIFSGASASFLLVINGNRILAIPAILISTTLYFLVSKVLKSKFTELSAENNK